MGEIFQADRNAAHAAIEAVRSSSFNVLVLSFLQASNVNGSLELSYNGDAFSSLRRDVPQALAQLKTGTGNRARKRILISMGGWGSAPMFEKIRSFGAEKFVRQLTAEVIAPLNLDGIDLDAEPTKGGLDQWLGVQREYGVLLAQITNEYKRLHPTHIVTHSPISPIAAEYYAKDTPVAGLATGMLRATGSRNGNNIDWLNVQFYEGGVVDGGDIAGFYRKSLAGALVPLGGQTGIRNPVRFFTPAFEPEANQPLTFCQQTIGAINGRCADLHSGYVSGVAVWDYRQVASSIADWSRGLEEALHSGAGKANG